MISQEQASFILRRALKTGADFAEIYLERSLQNSLNYNQEVMDAVTFHQSAGAGIRVFFETKTAYAYTSSLDFEELLRTADLAAEAIAVQIAKEEVLAAPVQAFCVPNTLPEYQKPYIDVKHQERILHMKAAARAAKAHSAEIQQVQVGYSDSHKEVQIFNSEGLFAQDARSHGRIRIVAIASDGDKMMTGSSAPGTGRDFSFFADVDWEKEAIDAAQTAVTMLHAPECPAAHCPVIIDNGFGGVLFHEACGHSLEATFVAKNESVFSGKLGEKIAASCVSAMDDGTIPGEWGSSVVDDEGTPTQRNLLIENGVLKSYLVDRLGSRQMNAKMTGSARRENFTYAATSRMNNTFIMAGNDSREEMFSSMPEGLYAKKLGGGSVNPITGDFNFVVQEGYWVKNGQIVTPVRGATLIGKGSDVLQKIDRVGSDLLLSQGVCGSVSGSIPANVGQPCLRVSEMVVGGSGGAL